MTEKISRHGYHVGREYALDPLEITLVRDVMRTNVMTVGTNTPLECLATALNESQRLFPVVDGRGRVTSVVTRTDLENLVREHGTSQHYPCPVTLIERDPIVAYPDEPLRAIIFRMAETGFTRLPVVERQETNRLVGLVSLKDLLKAREELLETEQWRERVLDIAALHRRFVRKGVPPGADALD